MGNIGCLLLLLSLQISEGVAAGALEKLDCETPGDPTMTEKRNFENTILGQLNKYSRDVAWIQRAMEEALDALVRQLKTKSGQVFQDELIHLIPIDTVVQSQRCI